MSQRETVISLRNVSKTFSIKDANVDSIRDRIFNVLKINESRKIQALQPVDLDIKKGEFFGIIGRNGSGKSTLLKIIMGAIRPDQGGIVDTTGKMMRLSLAMGFDPGLTARENIYVNGSLLGITFKQIGTKFDEIIAFAELEKFVDTKVKFYSTGMRSRLAFAIAVHAEADIFLFDEFFGGVGDLRFKAKSDKVFKERMLGNKTIVIVSHSMQIIQQYCNRVLCIDKGKIIGVGPTQKMINIYKEEIKKR